MNRLTKPSANIIPGVNLIFACQRVVSQLNTLMADGTAINNVSNTNTEPRNGFRSGYKHMVRPNQEREDGDCEQ